MAGPNDFLYALRDAEFRDACDSITLAECDAMGSFAAGCGGCPAWEGLKARVAARTTAGDQPGILVRQV